MAVGGSPTHWRRLEDLLEERIVSIWTNLLTNNLWQRILKNTIATTLAVILGLIPAVVNVYGRAIYLAPITTVFGHPGRRFGQMFEALLLCVLGTSLGVGWSFLGIYLSSLVYDSIPPAAYTIKGLFLAVALLFHGFLRSHTPRLFIFVLLLIIVAVVALTGSSTSVSSTLATTLFYPILTAVAILLLVNILIFPEFSSSFLGITTIETLADTVGALRDAGLYFVNTYGETEERSRELSEEAAANHSSRDEEAKDILPASDDQDLEKGTTPAESESAFFIRVWRRVLPDTTKEGAPGSKKAPIKPQIKLSTLSGMKAKLRAKLASCKAAQSECAFEIAFAVLPPRDLKHVSDTAMKKLVGNTIALIGACESKYALIGDEFDVRKESVVHQQLKTDADTAGIELPVGSSGENTPSSGLGEAERVKKGAEPRKKSIWDSLFDDDEESHSEKTSIKEKNAQKKKKKPSRLQHEVDDLELIKLPRREIEFGDRKLLSYLVKRISSPIKDLQANIDESVNAITACLAFCYDVQRLPSGARPPTGVEIEELDIRIDSLEAAILDFDRDSALALEKAAVMHDSSGSQLDIMPRMETFLVSSFLLNLRQAARHTKEMLVHTRRLVEKRQSRHERRRFYAPKINWRKWLASGGEADGYSLPEQGRKNARSGKMDVAELDTSPTDSSETLVQSKERNDEEAGANLSARSPHERELSSKHKRALPQKEPVKVSQSRTAKLRNELADFIEYMYNSDDTLYAFKLTIAVFLVVWPAFVASWNYWYYLNRGLWAALQLVLITENSIGSSVYIFLLRAAGTSIGCLWGYAAYAARDGDPYAMVVLLVIGIIPSSYVQLGSKYIKAGMVSIISMCVIALSTKVQTVPGSVTENFLKRFIAFLIGGVVALVVEVVILPVRARDRLVESLASSIHQINEMEACLAYGIESGVNVDPRDEKLAARFDAAKAQAEGALTAAGTFLPFCAQEPRIKGSFAGLSLVYSEMLFVLHQIVDKMDNMLVLRREYGSGVLEEFNEQVFAYRRNVAGSITLVLFSIHEALTTKLPLPQFLPSARLAHVRMVNRVREIVLQHGNKPDTDLSTNRHHHGGSVAPNLELNLVKRILRQKFLSWNAASAGQIEVIEYLEELIDLTKLLVGANEFRSGLLTRPTYRDYVERIGNQDGMNLGGADSSTEREKEELRDVFPDTLSRGPRSLALAKVQGGGPEVETPLQRLASGEKRQEDLPLSLQRVRSRRMELTRSREEESWTSGRDKRRMT